MRYDQYAGCRTERRCPLSRSRAPVLPRCCACPPTRCVLTWCVQRGRRLSANDTSETIYRATRANEAPGTLVRFELRGKDWGAGVPGCGCGGAGVRLRYRSPAAVVVLPPRCPCACAIPLCSSTAASSIVLVSSAAVSALVWASSMACAIADKRKPQPSPRFPH